MKMTVVTTGGSRNELIEDVIATRCAYWDSLFAQASSQRRLASEACRFRLPTESCLRCNCCQPGNRDHPLLTVLNGASGRKSRLSSASLLKPSRFAAKRRRHESLSKVATSQSAIPSARNLHAKICGHLPPGLLARIVHRTRWSFSRPAVDCARRELP